MGMQNVGGRRRREISRGNMSIFEEEEEDILRRRILPETCQTLLSYEIYCDSRDRVEST